MKPRNQQDVYREWSYSDRCKARNNPEQRENCRRYDKDAASSDRAFNSYITGGEYSDPDPDGRFH